ncbi:MAG: metallopeptidase family protein [Actinobacteria bacterium]|nr:metallopeptidase family protein [Actinomycetota bacterium]
MRFRDRISLAWRHYKLRQRVFVQRIENFELTAKRSEMLAREAAKREGRPQTPFEHLVAEAIDELPDEFRAALGEIPVVVSDGGVERRAYGLYEGDTIARDNWADRILIFQDTLERDFGHNVELLRAQVQRTVRHELAHHLGWDEDGVRELGL